MILSQMLIKSKEKGTLWILTLTYLMFIAIAIGSLLTNNMIILVFSTISIIFQSLITSLYYLLDKTENTENSNQSHTASNSTRSLRWR